MATKKDLTIDQGSRFNVIIAITWPTDITGYSVRGMVRQRVTDASVLFDMTNYLTVDVANKQVVVDVPASVTATMTWDNARYDIEIYNGAVVYRILQGGIVVDKEVTH